MESEDPVQRRMEEEAQELVEATMLREAVRSFSDRELLSAYVVLEKLGVVPGSTVLEESRHRLAVRIYRAELMERMGRRGSY